MRIGPLGTREVTALALLIGAVVVGLAVTFFRSEDDAESNAATELIAQRTAAADPNRFLTQEASATAAAQAATPTKTPTPLPAIKVSPPSGWQVRYESKAITGGYNPEAFFAIEELDLSFAGAPFPDMKDNAWRTVLAGELVGGRVGPWKFTIEYQGEIKVFIAENLVAEGTASKPTKLDVIVPSASESTSIRIEAVDSQGSFLLRWK